MKAITWRSLIRGKVPEASFSFRVRYDFGGNEVTEMFGRILSARYGPSFLKGNGLDFEVENMKKEICFVAEDFAEQLYEGQHSNDGEIFQLPDRKKILVTQFVILYIKPLGSTGAIYCAWDLLPTSSVWRKRYASKFNWHDIVLHHFLPSRYLVCSTARQ